MKPRQILEGTTYLITRRTNQRMFLLRPSTVLNACIRFCLAMAQRRSGVKIHSVIFLSNHYHIILTDPDGTLPEFTEELNKLLACSLNRHHRRSENLWSAGHQTSQVELGNAFDVMWKTVYVLANATQAMLVAHGSDWPGVRLYRKGRYKAVKPKFFFRQEAKGGELPDTAQLVLTAPPIEVHESLCDEVVQKAACAREKEIRDRARREGRSFKGPAKVRSQKITRAPQTPAKRGGISPRVASRERWRRIEVLQRLAQFVAEHRKSRLALLAGLANIVFPTGTYQMARQCGMRCADS